MSEQIEKPSPEDYEVIEVVGERPTGGGIPDVSAIDIALTTGEAIFDPGGLARDKIGDVLKTGIDGDLNDEAIRKGMKVTGVNRTSLGEDILDLAVDRGLRRLADTVSLGAASGIGAILDVEEYKSDHQEMIKSMAEKGVPGYKYIEKDINGDGKIDKIYVDATACLDNLNAKAAIYVDDGIADRKRVGSPSNMRTKRVPDEPEVAAAAEVARNEAEEEIFEIVLESDERGRSPSRVHDEYVKDAFSEKDAVVVAQEDVKEAPAAKPEGAAQGEVGIDPSEEIGGAAFAADLDQVGDAEADDVDYGADGDELSELDEWGDIDTGFDASMGDLQTAFVSTSGDIGNQGLTQNDEAPRPQQAAVSATKFDFS